MKVAIDRTSDRQLLQQLHRLGSATVAQLCAELGVTATAVRQRLMRLQSADLVTREAIRSGRGRPRHVYRLTEAGVRSLGENYGDLAAILWRELQRIQDPTVREHLVARIRDALVQRYGSSVDGRTLDERVAQLKEVLADRGFQVEVDCKDGVPTLRENNCPYPDLASRDPSICRLEQEVFQEILGEDVVLAHCCRDGDQYCEFQVVGAGKSWNVDH
ncbi:MAG TPA: MarR family transcriptional regulator [Planctomycetaceae bacterium]|nr:MarR family transcriptional regulator [Planctomycetaceae bacterium]